MSGVLCTFSVLLSITNLNLSLFALELIRVRVLIHPAIWMKCIFMSTLTARIIFIISGRQNPPPLIRLQPD